MKVLKSGLRPLLPLGTGIDRMDCVPNTFRFEGKVHSTVMEGRVGQDWNGSGVRWLRFIKAYRNAVECISGYATADNEQPLEIYGPSKP